MYILLYIKTPICMFACISTYSSGIIRSASSFFIFLDLHFFHFFTNNHFTCHTNSHQLFSNSASFPCYITHIQTYIREECTNCASKYTYVRIQLHTKATNKESTANLCNNPKPTKQHQREKNANTTTMAS